MTMNSKLSRRVLIAGMAMSGGLPAAVRAAGQAPETVSVEQFRLLAPVRVATSNAVDPYGLRIVDGVQLREGDLILHQHAQHADQGIWKASKDRWLFEAPLSTLANFHGLLFLPVREGAQAGLLAYRVPGPSVEDAGGWIPIQRNAASQIATDRGSLQSLLDQLTSDAGPHIAVRQDRASPAIRIDQAFEFGVRLTRYGFVGDGRVDDSQAWRDAIEEARDARAPRTIIVPFGQSRVTRPIVDDGNPLPPGVTFQGESRSHHSEYQQGSYLRYEGKGACWDIAYPYGGTASLGNWGWRDMAFWCSDPDGTMFDFGKTQDHIPTDDKSDPHQYLQRIDFQRIYAVGAAAGKSQTGDFIRACKTFYLSIDNSSTIRGFRRGVWLKGCDNCRIDASFYGNVRHIHAERVGRPFPTFGNELEIGSRYFGEIFEGPEEGYCIYDDGCFGTTIRTPLLEATGGPKHATALIYLNGYGTRIEQPIFSFAPLFRLGPGGREIVLTSPRMTVTNAAWRPVIDNPVSWDFGYGQEDFRMRVVDAPANVKSTIGHHPRVLYFDSSAPVGAIDANVQAVPTPHGYQPPIICHALNYFGRSEGAGHKIDGLVQDREASNGWAIKIGKGKAGAGFNLTFHVGQDLVRGMHRLRYRMRLENPGQADWSLALTSNGLLKGNFPTAGSHQYRIFDIALDLRNWTVGDPVTLSVSCDRPASQALLVDYVSIQPVQDEGWSKAVGPARRSDYSAYAGANVGPGFDHRQMQAMSDALKATSERVIALEEALRNAGIID